MVEMQILMKSCQNVVLIENKENEYIKTTNKN